MSILFDEVTALAAIDALITRQITEGFAPTLKEMVTLRAEMVLSFAAYRQKPSATPLPPVSGFAQLEPLEVE